MFQRDIEEHEVEEVVEKGEIIESYSDDKPYPSFLVFGVSDSFPLHVVYARDKENNTIIITAYRPNLEKWQDNFKTRKV
jgi:hypothetical protein